jgi:hypothetical protein
MTSARVRASRARDRTVRTARNAGVVAEGFRMIARTRVAAALLAACAFLLAGSASTRPAAAQDAGALRALAERVARDSTLGPADVELFPGSVPALPVAFVPPAGAIVAGTALERPRADAPGGAYRFTRYRVYFSAAATPQELVDALAAGFTKTGYARVQTLYGTARGGFGSASPVTANLCRATTDPRVLVRARTAGAQTDAVVEETIPARDNPPDGGGPCDPARRVDPLAAFPLLRSARAVAVTTRANTITPDALVQTADVYTALPPRTVLDGWAAQAVADGWTQRTVTSTEEAALATFSRDAGGAARLLVVSLVRVRPGQYYASLTNAATPAEPNAPAAGR